MENNIYLPPKGAKWDDTSTLGEESDIGDYSDDFGDMNILNESEIEEAIYPKVKEIGHKDGKFRHPETLYLVPGNPRHRSDSQYRS